MIETGVDYAKCKSMNRKSEKIGSTEYENSKIYMQQVKYLYI